RCAMVRSYMSSAGGLPIPARGAGRSRPRSTNRCPRRCSARRCTRDSPPGARTTGPIACCPRCATSSAATWRRPRPAWQTSRRGGTSRGRAAILDAKERAAMKPTQQLHELGQSLWLDNITRALLTSGTLKRYIDELSVTGLTSNPTIFDHAISKSTDYDAAIREKLAAGQSGEALFFDIALEDITA